MPIGNAATSGPGAPGSGAFAIKRWTDKSFPATRDKQGQTDKPDFDFVNLGLLFPQNDPSEIVYLLDQMEHTKQLGTPLRLHVHWVQDEVALPNFTCQYRFYNNGEAIPSFTTINTDAGAGPVFTYPGTPIVNLARFPEIPAPADEKISAVLDLKIFRNDNRVAGDVLVKYIDYHFLIDATGSFEEFVK